jgi:hypothetical protein
MWDWLFGKSVASVASVASASTPAAASYDDVTQFPKMAEFVRRLGNAKLTEIWRTQTLHRGTHALSSTPLLLIPNLDAFLQQFVPETADMTCVRLGYIRFHSPTRAYYVLRGDQYNGALPPSLQSTPFMSPIYANTYRVAARVGQSTAHADHNASGAAVPSDDIAWPVVNNDWESSELYVALRAVVLEWRRRHDRGDCGAPHLALIPIGLYDFGGGEGHQNMLVIDREFGVIEIFEPNGAWAHTKANWYHQNYTFVVQLCHRLAADLSADDDTEWQVREPVDLCPRLGPQTHELRPEIAARYGSGWCVTHANLYGILRLTNPRVPPLTLMSHLMSVEPGAVILLVRKLAEAYVEHMTQRHRILAPVRASRAIGDAMHRVRRGVRVFKR